MTNRPICSGALAALVVFTSARASAQADPSAGVSAPPAGEAGPPAGDTASAPLAPRRPLGGRPAKEDRFVWRYPEFRTGEYIATAVFGGLALGSLIIPTTGGRWVERNSFDEGVRDGLRLEHETARRTADDISDLTLTFSMNYLAFDAGVVAWWGRDKGSVAYQMAAIDVETIAVTAGVTSLVKGIAARKRPYRDRCLTDATYARTNDCETDGLDRSFLSGHTSTTFAAAGLTCMHHANLALYDSPAGDAAACAGAFVVAGATGALRIMSDNHYATDVATGAALGTLLGLGMPWLLHYKDDISPDALDLPGKPDRDAVTVTFIPGPTSGTFVGTF